MARLEELLVEYAREQPQYSLITNVYHKAFLLAIENNKPDVTQWILDKCPAENLQPMLAEGEEYFFIAAAKSGNAEVICQLLKNCEPKKIPEMLKRNLATYKVALEHGNLNVVNWLYAAATGHLPWLKESAYPSLVKPMILEYYRENFCAAAKYRHLPTLQLLENADPQKPEERHVLFDFQDMISQKDSIFKGHYVMN